MADQTETLRQLIAGYTSMQYQLGLLPSPLAQAPLGVQLGAPPRAVAVPHPGEIAAQQSALAQQVMRQTLDTAQMTRYVPPPSTPIGGSPAFGWGATVDQIARQQLNPYVAGALGGSAAGLPNPMFATAPQYGMFRPPPPVGGSVMSAYAHVPSLLNPWAPSLPVAHFSTPAMQQLQLLRAHQAEGAATLGSVVEGGLGLGGAVLGGALGAFFGGPLGGFVGSWAGQKLGGLVSDMSVGVGMQDIRRGRQLQNTTAPFMVTGPNLDPFTGQGLERRAARDTAVMLRQLVRDHDFQRTGFDTADVMRLTQLASDQGLLQTAHNPDDIATKMKSISKAVKTLMQVTGDPDVRSALASLGQMRQLGFDGLGAQMGAVANRAMFARMAGISQAAAHEQYGLPGAMTAQSIGLAGSTGYQMGVASAGVANVAVSAGALNDLQLARAGGKQGLAQTNVIAQLGAANEDIYLGAAIGRNQRGELDIDPDAYRRAQRMKVSEVAREASRRLNALGARGIYELSTRKQELKDRLQQLSPTDQLLNVLHQAEGLQRDVGGGMNLGAALRVKLGASPMGQGMSDTEREQMARSLEQQFTSRAFYEGLEEQLRVRRREEADRARAARERWRTPGLLTNLGRGTQHVFSAVGDAIASPFRNLAERADRVEEDRAAFERGEHLRRFEESQIIRTESDRHLALDAARSGDFRRLMGGTGRDPLASTGFIDNGRSMNRLGQMVGVTSYNATNKLVLLGNESTRSLFGFNTSYGGVDVARQRMQNVAGAARFIRAGAGRSAEAAGSALAAISSGKLDAMAVVLKATAKLKNALPKARAGGLLSSGATGADVFRKTAIEALTESGLSRTDAERLYDANAELIGGEMARQIYLTGDQSLIEPMEKALDLADRASAIDLRQDREQIAEQFKRNLDELGISGLGKKTLESIKNVVKQTDPKILALAAAQAAGNQPELERLHNTYRRANKDVGKGNTAFLEASREASSLLQAQSKDVRQAIAQIGEHGQGNLEQRIREARHTLGVDMARQAFESTAQRISEEVGDTHVAGAASPRDLMERLQSRSLEGIKNKAQRAAIEAWRRASSRGDNKGMSAAEDAFSDAATQTGARSRVEVFGGGQSGTSEIDRQIAELDEAKKKFGTDRPDDKTQMLFASSVELFAQAAKDLKSATESIALSNTANPRPREF